MYIIVAVLGVFAGLLVAGTALNRTVKSENVWALSTREVNVATRKLFLGAIAGAVVAVIALAIFGP